MMKAAGGATMNNYEDLANAIILQAVKDYRAAYKSLKRNPDRKVAESEVRELIRFFTSDWFSALTDVDGPRLVSKLNDKFDEEIRTGKAAEWNRKS